MKRFKLFALLLFLPLVSCMSSGSIEEEFPSDSLIEALPGNWTQKEALKGLPITSSLFDIIRDRELAELVLEAQAGNPDLKATALRLEAAGHRLGLYRSRFFPQIGAGLDGSRHNQGVDSLTGNRKTENELSGSLDISWEIDIWGRINDEQSAAAYLWKSSAQNYELLRDSLGVRVVQTWIELSAARQLVELDREKALNLNLHKDSLYERFQNGNASLDELSIIKSRIALAEAQLYSRENRVRELSRGLELLMGRSHQNRIAGCESFPEVRLPNLDSTPLEVILNRPDIALLVMNFRAAERSEKAAKKAFLPGVNLSSSLLKEGSTLSSLGSGTLLWNLMGSLTLPLFAGGKIRSEIQACSSETQASLYELQSQILIAFKEVEDRMAMEKETVIQEKAFAIAEEEALRRQSVYEQRYRRGTADISELLDIRDEAIESRARRIGTKALLLSNRIDLALALGFGLDSQSRDSLDKTNTNSEQNKDGTDA